MLLSVWGYYSIDFGWSTDDENFINFRVIDTYLHAAWKTKVSKLYFILTVFHIYVCKFIKLSDR